MKQQPMNRSLSRAVSLVAALAGLVPSAADARVPVGEIVTMKAECREARYPIGFPLTGEEIVGKINLGEVVAIDRIRSAAYARTVGFLYTTGEGRTFVTDRPLAHLQLIDLVVMNQVEQMMGFVLENAFDPRDNGFVYYLVTWNPQVAETMQLRLARCVPPGD